jgi:formylglycine-generating enzyme required for sulfatase activity
MERNFIMRNYIAISTLLLLSVNCCAKHEKGGLFMTATNAIGMKLVYVPAGDFMMGSPSDEKDRFDNEGPQHKVTISKGFYIGIYEVTQAQYQAVKGINPSNFKGY